MEKVLFNLNIPVELALKYTQGKPSESKYGAGMQHMFSTADGRVFYVSETAGQAITEQLAALGVQPGEFVTITKAECDMGRGKKAIRWQVAQVAAAAEPMKTAVAAPPPAKRPPQSIRPAADADYGERSNGTYAVPALKSAPVADAAPDWARVLLTQTNYLVDILAASVKHAARHEGLIKPDAVQSILISAYIGLQKQGGSR